MPETDILIRPIAGEAEIKTCARMMANSEPWITLQRDYDAAVINLSMPTKEIYVAVLDEQLVGFVVLNMHGALTGYLQTICVAPEHRSQQIGRKLIAFAEERVFRDSPNIFLCVTDFNERAQRLYKSLGYEMVGVLKDYVIAGYDELLMRKSISPLRDFKKK